MDTPENQPAQAGIEQLDETTGAESAIVAETLAAVEQVLEDLATDSVATDDGQIPAVDDKSQDEFSWPTPDANENATLSTPYSKSVGDNWDDLATTIALPSDSMARTLNYGNLNPHAAAQVDTEEGMRWSDVISDGMNNGSFQDNLMPAARREGADYQQRIQAGDRVLAIAAPRLGGDDGPLLTGERATLRVNALMGRGAIMSIPLWHSGFWITLKSPGEIDLLDTLQHIVDNKIVFGRSSNGLAFANHAVLSNSAIVDLALRNLYETSVQGFNTITKIRGAINALDIPMIAWGLACTVYPKGFQFERSLLDSKGIATKVVNELLNVGSCLWTDRSSLNDWQIAHMAKRATGSMSEESLKIYREHFTRGKPKLVMLNDEVGVTLKVPTIDEYLNAGQRWVDELVMAVNQAFTQDLSEKQRNDLIFDRAKATSMRQYCHWIEAIELPKLNQRIPKVEDIERTVASLSSDDATRDKYYEVVQAFINESIVSLIGVPQVHPDEASNTLPRFENIIPLDPIAVFFNLLYQKIQQIRLRP